MSDWLDIDDQPPALPVAVPENIADSLVEYGARHAELSDKQKEFLKVLQDWRFNVNAACRATKGTDQQVAHRTAWTWIKDPSFGFCFKVLRKAGMPEILSKEKLVTRHDELVESLMTPKPVLYQGIPVFVDGQILHEIDAGAAAKVNKDLMEIGGHAKPQEGPSFGNGPPLIIQVTNRIGGEVISQVTVGAIPQQAAPEDEWLSIPSDQ